MDTTPEIRTYRIPTEAMGDLERRFNQIERRAAKLGVPAPTFCVVDTDRVEQADRPGVFSVVNLVQVQGEGPKFAGWEMVAVIDRDPQNPTDANLVTAFGTEADPAWYTMPERCDHCGVNNRGRRLLVVVDHEGGERQIVGTTCLRDFLGHTSPEAIASWVEFLAGLDEEMVQREQAPAGEGVEYRYDPTTYLAYVLATMGEYGWVSRAKARDEERTATADEALSWMTGALGLRRIFSGETRPRFATEAEETEAAEVLAWGRTLTPGEERSDYLDNLAVVAHKTDWRVRDLGIGGSMVVGYRKAMDLIRERDAEAETKAQSSHVGQVGERLELEGVVEFSLPIDGDYGVSTLTKVRTDEGNLLVWFASGTVESGRAPALGDCIRGKATVKAHDEYRGEAQTKVNRWKWEEVA